MTNLKKRNIALFATTAMVSALTVGFAQAQTQSAAAAPQGSVIEEVLVTATRQSSTVNKVALSVTAVGQQTLDNQGVKNVQGLTSFVPAVTFHGGGGDYGGRISVRGITSQTGAQTTGVYLDDIPLQKRDLNATVTGGGTPFPQLFDLERVEVLRGPQGTLYGGSSQGGTVRFITPTPSLNRYSAYARAEVNGIDHGSMGTEAGLAVGGPIVADAVGFRASVLYRRNGGWIDHVNAYTGKTIEENTNRSFNQAARVSVLWAVTPKLNVTGALYASRDKNHDASSFWADIPQHSTTTQYYSPTGVRYGATPTGPVGYISPGSTYGPYNMFGFGKTGANAYNEAGAGVAQTVPRTSRTLLPSVVVDYDLDTVSFKSITSYLDDYALTSPNLTNALPPQTPAQAGAPFIAGYKSFYAPYYIKNTRKGWTQEFRLASTSPSARLTYVAGVYYSKFDLGLDLTISGDLDSLARALGGPAASATTLYGAPVGPQMGLSPFGVPYYLGQVRQQAMTDQELAAFGEANFSLTERLKVTAGVRVSKADYDFYQLYYGAIAGIATPTVENSGITRGSVSETPINPKFGLAFQRNSDQLYYATAAKGYRTGGVNAPVPAVKCAADLAVYGGTPPVSFNSDSLWSYEGGAKLRMLGGRAQLNSSAYYIDWKNIQLNQSLPTCGQTFVTNAGSAVSKGFDTQLALRLGEFTLNAAAAYTNVEYAETVLGPPRPGTGARAIVVGKGDKLPVPAWTATLGGEYRFPTFSNNVSPYVRFDYAFTGKYKRTAGPGALAYAPDVYRAKQTNMVNMRAGAKAGDVDVSLFANNLFNSRDILGASGGRGGCRDLSCSTYASYTQIFTLTSFQPRTVGVTVVYRR